MNVELITNVLVLAVASTLVSTQLIQRAKENFKITNSIALAIVSLIISFAIGFLFTITFSELDKIMACWVGIITYAGAEIIYQNFKDKLGLKSLTELEKEESE